MTVRSSARDILILSVMITLASYVVVYCMVFVHEMTHGCTAVALGGYFPSARIGISGGNAVYVFPFGSGAWKEVLVLLAGPLVTLIAAPLMLGLVATGVKNTHLKLLAILVGALSSAGFATASGLFSTGRSAGGDVGRALAMAGLPGIYRGLLGVIWLLLGLALFASFFHLFFRELMQHFPAATYPRRLLLVLSSAYVPALIVIGANSIISSAVNGHTGTPVKQWVYYLGFIALSSLLVTLAISFRNFEPAPKPLTVSRRQVIGLLVAAALAATAHAATNGRAGNTRQGLVLTTRPPEVNVSSCNIILNLNEDLHGQVLVLMRPYEEQHRFLWERIKETGPREWTYYERFVKENLRLMLATDVRIVAHRADPYAPYFSGKWETGARIVEAEVDLSRIPSLAEGSGGRLLKLVDFWRSKGAGYIDFAEVNVGGRLRISDFKSQPERAGAPSFASGTRLRWENSSFESSFAVAYLAIN